MDLATGAVPGVHEALADDVAETHRLGDAHNALMAVAVEVSALAETTKLTAERVEVPADLALDDVEVAAHGVSFPLCRYHHSKLPTHKYGKVGTKLTAERVEVPADLALDDVEVAAHGVSFPLCRYHHSKLPTHKYGKVGTYIYRTQPFSWTRG